jgi:hypothetical protein
MVAELVDIDVRAEALLRDGGAGPGRRGGDETGEKGKGSGAQRQARQAGGSQGVLLRRGGASAPGWPRRWGPDRRDRLAHLCSGSSRNLGSVNDTEQPSQEELIRQFREQQAAVDRLGVIGMAEAGERLGVSTREIVQAVYDRRLRHVIVHGIPYVPQDALEEYRKAR